MPHNRIQKKLKSFYCDHGASNFRAIYTEVSEKNQFEEILIFNFNSLTVLIH